MVRVTDEVTLAQDEVDLYYATDPHLANLPILIFHGPSTTTNSTLNSSRIQVHVFTAAGFQSYPRITISPNSPFYQSVNHLPRDKQGDEICRGLAFGLLKYFKELPEVVRSGLIVQCASSRGKRPGSAPSLFGEQHAADLAGSMVKVENVEDVMRDIYAALSPQNVNHVDIDLVLPPGSIAPFEENAEEPVEEDEPADPTLKQYGLYAPLVKLFGEVSFLPTSKLRRAPSKPNALNRTRSFLKDQKMSLRREMSELVDTEERYVMKMHELVNHIADDFRTKSKDRPFGSFSPSEEDLRKLFPHSLDRILSVNSAFLRDVRKVMDETEEDAMKDLEAPIASSTGSRYGGTGRLKDPTGTLAFSKVLLEWFPKFSECYQDYIRASQEFPRIISLFMKQQSSFSQRVQQTGEQRLRSAVIEPVQRLPRYSLFIDNIVNFLPVSHPALQSMLKARDIITSICSLDPPSSDKFQSINRLRHLVESWPSSLQPKGRLITAVDFVETLAPFHPPSTTSSALREGVLVLFADAVIFLRKIREGNLSARGLLAEVDKPSAATMMASVTAAAGGETHLYELAFSGWHSLADTRFTMSDNGRSIWITSLQPLKDPGTGRDRIAPPATVRNFVLQGAYELKAIKFTEEVTKARIEGRFSESERETDKWCLRSTKLNAASLHLHTAVFEEGIDTLVEGRREPAPIRIVIDHEKGTKGAPVGHYGVDIVANVSVMGGGFKYKLEIDGLHDRVFLDEVVLEHFLPTFAKRIVDLIPTHFTTRNSSLTSSLISFNAKILKSMYVVTENDRSKSFKPSSPVKMLSSFLSGGFGSSTTSLNGSMSGRASPTKLQKTSTMGEIPTVAPSVSRNNSNKSTHSIQDVDGRGSVRPDDRPSNPLVRLEETFTAYIAAIQARKGNVVGKVLRNRAAADELTINAIYNTFIENPFDQRAASEVTVDVLFVAFEKYLRMAWKDQMGQVMSLQTLDSLQERALKGFPGEFAEYVRMIFGEMAPQNRRAFIAMIKLLADLLDGCGNDGDRGALTVAFAELLITDGDPHDYINLLDRMVEDQERLFEDIGPGALVGFGSSGNSAYGSLNGNRSNPSATGSLTSNASSLRRRFADTLLRQNSKQDSDRPSVWRTLSKNSRNAVTVEAFESSSLSKATHNRSRSIESPSRRPASRDRPTVLGAFDERPSSSHGTLSRLSTIRASPPPSENVLPEKSLKKKRRSSLSDLKTMMAAATLGNSSPFSPSPERKCTQFNSSPRTPSPTKIPVSGGIMNRDRSLMYRNGSPTPKGRENIPLNSQETHNIGNLTERPLNIASNADVVVVKDLWAATTSPLKGHAKSASLATNIPTLRGRTPSISRPTTSPGKPSPQKLRLQSPQKLRERLQNEAKAINEAEASLQNELSKIGEEMAKLTAGSHSSFPLRNVDINKLTHSMQALEAKVPEMAKEFTARNEAVKADLEKSLQASEFKVKGLDQLYKEASAENELLYEKFNGELGKIVKALKGKNEREELVQKLKESSEETAKTKKENARLRRELLTLRTLLKAHE